MDIAELKPLIEDVGKTVTAIRAEVESVKQADVLSEQKLARMETDLAASLKAKQDADRAGDQHRTDADQHRYTAANDDPAVDITA